MSLITCPECGKEISDKASMCVHCGCPIEKIKLFTQQKKYVYMCMGMECLSSPFKEFDEYKGNIQVCPDCGGQLEYYETEVIDNDTNLVVKHVDEGYHKNIQNAQTKSIPICPTCKSSNVEKISTSKKILGGAMFGLFSSNVRNMMHCKNCGYKW